MIIHADGSTVERADVKMDKTIVLPSQELLEQISETEPQVALIPEGDHVAAAVKLHGYDDMYLYVARLLDPRVVQQLRATQESVGEYANLEARRLGIQIAFALMFAVIALIVLLSSAWIGLDFANRLVAPIRRLIGAANVVSTGNLQVQVPIHRSEGDLAHLGETFNKMTQELRTQHDDIVRARDLIDSRRRFHRGGARRRQRRRHRRQCRRPHHHPQPLGRTADRPHRERSRSAIRSPRSRPSLPRFSKPRATAISVWSSARSPSAATARSEISRCA